MFALPALSREQAPRISGVWESSLEHRYEIKRKNNNFSWRIIDGDQVAEGKIEGNHLQAVWHTQGRMHRAAGSIVEIDEQGRALLIEWSNNVVFHRAFGVTDNQPGSETTGRKGVQGRTEERAQIENNSGGRIRPVDISGKWFSNQGDRYKAQQTNSSVTLLKKEDSLVLRGIIDGDILHLESEPNRQNFTGHILEIDHAGKVQLLELSNGLLLSRRPFQDQDSNIHDDDQQNKMEEPRHIEKRRLNDAGIYISGKWSGTDGRIYVIDQDRDLFAWRIDNSAVSGEGRIEGRHVFTVWQNKSGPEPVDGEILDVSKKGTATRITWSNGIEFSRQINAQVGNGARRQKYKASKDKTKRLVKQEQQTVLQVNPLLVQSFEKKMHQKKIYNKWVKTGGPIGGLGYDVRFASNSSRGKKIVYVTDNYSGVNVSLDGGNFYIASNNGINVRTGDSGDAIPVFSLTVDPNNSQIIWAGLKDISGCYKSMDGGKNWHNVSPGGLGRFVFRGFAVMPGNSDLVFAAGEVPMNNPGKGFDRVRGRIYRTKNGGETWKIVWEGNDLTRYVIINPQNPQIIYASCGIFDREAHNSDCRNLISNDPNSPDFYRNRGGRRCAEEH